MRPPTTLEFAILILVSLLFAVGGLTLLVNFSKLFRYRIKNEIIRKNIVAWMVIFCLSIAMLPFGGAFWYLIERFGWGWAIGSQFINATACTLLVYNPARIISQHRKIKQLSFASQILILMITLILLVLAVNLPFSYWVYRELPNYLRYATVSSIYVAGTTALVYGVTHYMEIDRKRKLDAKELELSRLRELKTKAELDALHSKINPHFLYNALNSIADLSITDGKKARKMTIALADLFRYSINYSNNNFSTVKDEIEMAHVYLQIEKIRFEDKLNYNLDVEQELDHYLVPRFVLQPLVENAVKHALKATGQQTEIGIQVKRTTMGMVMQITDTGPGFPEQMNFGYGVKSVYDKLDLLFPGQYEIHFSNQPQKKVSLYIHKLVKDESAL